MTWQHQHGWLSLVEVSGPFLAVPVLREVFPQGFEELEPSRTRRLRSAYEEWRDAVDVNDTDLVRLHAAWIEEVLRTALEADDQLLRIGKNVPTSATVGLPEHGTTINPDYVFVDPTHGEALLMPIHVFPPDTDLSASMKFDGLSCSPGDRMSLHLRALGVPLGLVTNGERWMLIHAPVGQVTSFVSWYSRIWGQEPQTLRAFASLLSIRRFFAPERDRLPALFERSAKHQDEVTDVLGDQVRRAIEVLVQAFDRADQDRNRALLGDVRPQDLYEAGLTVMMRLVFVLAAEERGLLLLKEPRYDAFYAVSTLRMQLRAESDEILERRRSAWSRLLAVFRAIYGGVDHPTMRLPAMGGSLFDPDRFPFLEGRMKGTSWRKHRAEPLPIDDRTVLLLLEAIQTFQGRILSYRALDVEQIGHVYEGLLERTVVRVDDVTLELDANAQAKDPRVTLGELESAHLDGQDRVVALLSERSKRSESAIRNALSEEVDPQQNARLLSACRGDAALRGRLNPYARLLRIDPWGYPLVHPKGAFVVVLGADRRETGTHYTPKSLTEKIVEETLTPIVYEGPVQGAPRSEWKLKTPGQILDLKVCDPAMGSGAFLVQACRFLAARLVEAWAIEEAAGRIVDLTGQVYETRTSILTMSSGEEVRAENARRIVAERCLYGVDLNPLAVELAKLSLWLVTVSKGRPFGFLDHNLRCGDSLLGISRLEQLTELTLDPSSKRDGHIFGKSIEFAVSDAVELRCKLREIPIRDIRDVEAMATINADARKKLETAELLADSFVGIVFAEKIGVEPRLMVLAADADRIARNDTRASDLLKSSASADLSKDLVGNEPRNPFHWPLEFPDVFCSDVPGFDAIVGNPPFLGGQRITGVMGTAYRDWLVDHIADGRRGSADLVAYFFLRAWGLIREGGGFGLLAVNTIAEGDTRQVGLEAMVRFGAIIHAAYPNEPWPGKAAVVTSRIHIRKGVWQSERCLSDRLVNFISAYLSDQDEWTPKKLKLNADRSFQGSIVLGMGFVLSSDQAREMLDADPRNSEVIFPYLNGEDLNTDPIQRPSRWVINFWDWPEERAQEYVLPFERVLNLVKPERDKLSGNATAEERKRKWWLFGRDAKALYHAIGRGRHFERHPPDWNPNHQRLERVLVCSEVTKHLAFEEVPNEYVMSANLDVFTDIERFAICQSSLHEVWARQHSSRLETRLKYSPGNAYETFAFPEVNDHLRRLGDDLRRARRELMVAEQIGLTKLYNRVHKQADLDVRVVALRELQQEINLAVASAFGWTDLELGHGFHAVPYLPENDRIRFTICEASRLEILHRLSELNRRQYEEEVVSLSKLSKPKRRSKAAPAEQSEFALEDQQTPTAAKKKKSGKRRTI